MRLKPRNGLPAPLAGKPVYLLKKQSPTVLGEKIVAKFIVRFIYEKIKGVKKIYSRSRNIRVVSNHWFI